LYLFVAFLKAENWMPQDLSNFLWASASLRCDVPLPLDVLAARAADLRWHHFKPQELLIVGYGGISSHPKNTKHDL